MNREEYEIMYHLEDTHWWYVGMRGVVSQLLREHDVNSYPETMRVLDAGCGTGGTLQRLQGYAFAAGIDACEEALELCRKRGLHELVQGSVAEMPFADGSFDLILSFDVLYHRKVKDDMAALKEFRRLLKPGGRLLVRLPAYNWLRGSHDEAVHTRQRYDAAEIRRKMSQAGFQVERVTYANTVLFPIAALKRLGEMAFGWGGGSDVKAVSPLVNRALAGVLGMEARLLSITSLPWGLSVFGLGRVP